MPTNLIETLEKLFLPPFGSDLYHGYASSQDDTGTEPDELDPKSPEGKAAWTKWAANRGYTAQSQPAADKSAKLPYQPHIISLPL